MVSTTELHVVGITYDSTASHQTVEAFLGLLDESFEAGICYNASCPTQSIPQHAHQDELRIVAPFWLYESLCPSSGWFVTNFGKATVSSAL
jgi:hypothetical protein